jgi:hypothetical protein
MSPCEHNSTKSLISPDSPGQHATFPPAFERNDFDWRLTLTFSTRTVAVPSTNISSDPRYMHMSLSIGGTSLLAVIKAKRIKVKAAPSVVGSIWELD